MLEVHIFLLSNAEHTYSDLERRRQKIEMTAGALEEQKFEKVLYTYKQVNVHKLSIVQL